MTGDVLSVEDLKPQKTMGDHDLCWCRSGLEWKYCHRDRGQGTRTNVNHMLDGLRQQQAMGYCAHPAAGAGVCSGRPIAAHTIQKEGGLREISEDGHVLSLKKGAFNIGRNDGTLVPASDGIARASTFPGFCNLHDAMFSPAEQTTVVIGTEVAFLLSYRAVVYEKFVKEASIKSIDKIRQQADRGVPFRAQANIQNALWLQRWGSEIGLRDITAHKACYDLAYHTGFSGFHFSATEFDVALPVAACGAFCPDFDLFGQPIQSLAATANLDPIAVNLTTLNGRGVLILGWMGSEGAPAKFANSYDRLPDAEKANAAARITVEYLENTYGRPSWWQGLSSTVQDGVADSAFTLGPPAVCHRGTDGLCFDGRTFTSAAVVR